MNRYGSSPLTRGKPDTRAVVADIAGLIPAHAGKTCLPARAGTPRRAHPRSRGENRSWPSLSAHRRGSSPLTRGKRRWAEPYPRLPGLIPAHAGKTRCRQSTLRRAGAHPRSRGENRPKVTPRLPFVGSSPLTRGKPGTRQSTERMTGLIPAHAGKTGSTRGYPRRFGAHPRSRGENAVSRVVAFFEKGSSPLTRGKHPSDREHAPPVGLIPAHAGKTQRTSPFRPSRTAHPRSRGENNNLDGAAEATPGSSPLTRGKRG